MLQPRDEYNVPSLLLKADKNEAIFNVLGKNCRSLNTAVVRIDKTEASGYSPEFTNMQTCVVCFVRDSTKGSYFIRAYCLINYQLIWEHELYDEIKTKQVGSLQIKFKGKNGLMDLNFLSKEECKSFHYAVEHRYKTLKLRDNNPKSGPVSSGSGHLTPSGKKKVNKIDIGDPFDPRCLEHKGWDNTVLTYFLQKAGVSEQQLNDRNTKSSIYEFMNRQSTHVLNTVKLEIAQEIKKKSTSAIPPPPPPPPPPPAPPVMGSRENTPSSKPQPPPKPKITQTLPTPPDAHNEIMKSIQGGVKLKKTPYGKKIVESSSENVEIESSTKPINKEAEKENLDKTLENTNENKSVNENLKVAVINHSEDPSCLNAKHDPLPLTKASRSEYVSSVSGVAAKPEPEQCELQTNDVGNKVSFTDDLINGLQKTLEDCGHAQLSDDDSTDSEWDDEWDE